MYFLLESDNLFDIDRSELGYKVSVLAFSSSVTALICTPFVGYLYELFGRKCVILTCLFSGCLLLGIIPYTSPNFTLLIIVRSALGALEGYAAINPLIPDYIKSESRGAAIAVRSSAFIIGEIFNIVILFGNTVRMDLK